MKIKLKDDKGWEKWWECVWICANADPSDFSMHTPMISRQKKVNDRRSLASSETNGGMDRFSAQSCKFATSRVNLQISQLFSSPAKKRRNTGNGKFLTGFAISDRFWELLGIFRVQPAACLSDDRSQRVVSLEIALHHDWLLISHKSTLCFPTAPF